MLHVRAGLFLWVGWLLAAGACSAPVDSRPKVPDDLEGTGWQGGASGPEPVDGAESARPGAEDSGAGERETQEVRDQDAGGGSAWASPDAATGACDAAVELADAGIARLDGGGTTTNAGPAVVDDGVPQCRGVPMRSAGLAIAADGRSVEVACAGTRLAISVIEPAVLRLRYQGSRAATARPSYAVVAAPVNDAGVLFGGTDALALVCTDDLLLEVRRSDCHVRALAADGTLLLEDATDGGFFDDSRRGVTRVVAPGEHFYGFGERTGPLDKRGQAMTFWNTDAYQSAFGGYPPDADPLYQSIPFFIGLRGATAYGVFLDDTHRLRFDMGATDPRQYTLSTEGPEVDQYLFAGPGIGDVLRRYTALTGRTPLPPRWALGYHQSRWGYFPDARVLEVAREFRARSLPIDSVWLDIQHLDGFRSFTWHPAGFSNPRRLTSELDALGLRTVTIADPGLKVDPGWDIYDDGLAGGHFLKRQGADYVGKVWPGASVFPDFTSAQTRTWWGGLVSRASSQGVDGVWIDMNEPSDSAPDVGGTVPEDVACAGDGVPGTMGELHNVYALLEARATAEGLRAARPDRRPFVLTRAGYAGIQRYAAVWTGDAPSTWPTLQTTLPMLLALGLSGVPFVGSDVGGYSGHASPELFARWLQLGAVSPFFRGHVTENVNDQEPWAFGYEVTDISRAMLEERYRRLPYLYTLFREAAQTGAPVLRPLVYEFQADPVTATLGDQAMLGPFLMVAPVLTPGSTARAVYFPAGRWFELRSGAIIEGPTTRNVPVTLGAVPTYVREGAILPSGPLVQWADQAPLSNTLTLDVYPGAQPSAFTLYEDDGKSFDFERGHFSQVTYAVTRRATGATLVASARRGTYVPRARGLRVHVRRVDHGVTAVRLAGVVLPRFQSPDALEAAGEGYFYDEGDLSLVVAMPDRPGFELHLDYEPAVFVPGPLVPMRFTVSVPPGTPTAGPIFVATSASGWQQQPLQWNAGLTSASGTVLAPRGEWLFYKYTRGDWSTVERWSGCVEATNRYTFGQANPAKADEVSTWADRCR